MKINEYLKLRAQLKDLSFSKHNLPKKLRPSENHLFLIKQFENQKIAVIDFEKSPHGNMELLLLKN
jgi:hypothetical protein